ncbi:DeoR family transcriptional regulator [Streptomyces eurocidicus]|uniref:DeoR family transcriptional regulator n=1 Tax=Streptomyces eurocidicus TaxID=66423 RepID=A0A2N8NUW0_STREU|nr:WYL domain-containing protein [Streptomyces eurocidicus]MBB5122589.1 putative DNA-binding transcriptional regulator YafY [Streptomyces eurocidicus]MBF6056620.1 WYL domain-containing protein [Streptomyces eurocidicus]PNE32558.1 DeoR family transcriptional regulator [Streptomyces eurocidicus]
MTTDMPARMLRLLALLQTRREWAGTELADRLGVTTRTLRRDIDRLRELGYPVEGTTGRAGGYRLAAGTAMPPLLLDDDEAVAIAVALRTATTDITGIEETALRALAKLEQVLPTRLRTHVAALQQATTAPVAYGVAARAQADPAALALLAAACRDREIVTFGYTTRHGTPGPRRAEPHSLVPAAGRWYLVAYDTHKDDWRTYRLDRITDPTPTGHRVPPRELPAPDPAAYLAAKIATAPARYRAVATVAASAATALARTQGLPERVTPLTAETCAVDLSGDSLHRIAQLLAALGEVTAVEADPEVLTHLRTVARSTLRLTEHSSDSGPPRAEKAE